MIFIVAKVCITMWVVAPFALTGIIMLKYKKAKSI